jgi:hypothetical protein
VVLHVGAEKGGEEADELLVASGGGAVGTDFALDPFGQGVLIRPGQELLIGDVGLLGGREQELQQLPPQPFGEDAGFPKESEDLFRLGAHRAFSP